MQGFQKVLKNDRETGEWVSVTKSCQVYLKNSILFEMGITKGSKVDVLVNIEDSQLAVVKSEEDGANSYKVGENGLLSISKPLKILGCFAPINNVPYEVKEGFLILQL